MRRRIFLLWMIMISASFGVVLVVTGYGALRLLPYYKDSVAKLVTQLTGADATFNVHYLDFSNLNPTLEIEDFVLKTKQSRLAIPSMRVKIDGWASLRQWSIVTKKVELQKPTLSINLGTGSQIFSWQELTSSQLNNFASKWHRLWLYMFDQKNVNIDNFTINLRQGNVKSACYKVDAKFVATDALSADMQVSIKNSHRANDVLHLTMNLALNQQELMINSTLEDPNKVIADSVNDWLGNDYLGGFDNGRVKLSVATLPDKLTAMKVFAKVAQIDLQPSGSQGLILHNVVANLNLQRYKDRLVLNASPLTFISRGKKYVFRSALFSVTKKNFEVNIPDLNLVDFSNLLQNHTKKWLRNLQLSGHLHNLYFSINLLKPALSTSYLSAEFENIAVKRSNGTFDFSGLTGKIDWRNDGVELLLDAPKFALGKNDVFSKIWPQLAINSKLHLVQNKDEIKINIQQLQAKNEHLQLSTLGQVAIPKANPLDFGLDIQGQIKGQKLTKEYQSFLPKKGIPPDLYQWLMQSLYGAKSLTAKFKIEGMAREIPYDKQSGVFFIQANVKGGQISPYYGWGVASNVDGQITFDNQALTASVYEGSLGGMPIKHVGINIENIAPSIPSSLRITTQGEVDSQQLFKYLNVTKARGTLRAIKRYVNYHGPLGIKLALEFPLGNALAKDQMSGVVTTKHGIISFPSLNERKLYNVDARIKFDNDKLEFQQFLANFKEGQVFQATGDVDLGNLNECKYHFAGSADVPVNFILMPSYMQMLFAKPLLSGQTAINFKLEGAKNSGALSASTDWFGLTSQFAMPLSKPSYLKLPTQLLLSWQQQKQKLNLISKLSINGRGKLVSQMNIDNNKIEDIGLSGHVDYVNSELIFQLQQNRLAKENALFTPSDLLLKSAEIPNTITEGLAADDYCLVARNYYDCHYRSIIQQLNISSNIKVNNLKVLDKDYQNIQLNAYRGDKKASVVIKDDKQKLLQASIPYRLTKPILLSLNDIFIPYVDNSSHGKEQAVNKPLSAVLQPQVLGKIPNVDMQAKNLQVGKYTFPKVLLSTQLAVGKVVIPAFLVKDERNELMGHGELSSWHSQLKASLVSLNFGSLFANFGYGDLIKDGQGKINVNLSWDGFAPSPFDIDGDLYIYIGNGAFLSVDSGLAKYIGLLSVDSYFKRLFLSNQEFGTSAMPFGRMVGHFKMHDGVMESAPSLIIDTPSFALVLQGKADVRHQTLDQIIKYQPHLSGTTAAVTGLLAGPVIGMAAYIGSKLVGNTLFKNAGLVSFHVFGPWNKPKVKQYD